MARLDLTQGDDWEMDIFLEEFDEESGEWVPVPIQDITFAVGMRQDAYQRAWTVTKIDEAGGHARAALGRSLSALAPVGVLMSNVQTDEAGRRQSSAPFAINCIPDYTP